jgi:predicted NodU family carbamoyl transferase
VRRPNEPVRQFHMDMASIQAVLGSGAGLTRTGGGNRHGEPCLAGGVALNCVANVFCGTAASRHLRPAAGDAAGAVSAALATPSYAHGDAFSTWHRCYEGAYLGPSFTKKRSSYGYTWQGRGSR